jgi:hypothetical protein
MRLLPRVLPVLSALALLGACRDGADSDAAASTDSAFARDLALAQSEVAPTTVFNDAPLSGSTTPAVTPAPEPARAPARSTRPAPAPRRQSPPARVSTTPRPTPPEPRATEPEAAPTPATSAARPDGATGVIGAGTRVGMTTNGRACTSALAGDKFTATVTSTVTGSNGASIPAGSTVVLEVTSVERADPIEASRIHFHVRAIDVSGESRPGEGDVATLGQMETVRVSGGSDRTKVVGGAVAGAILGRVLGGGTKGTVIGAAAGAAAGSAASRRSQGTVACLPEGSALQLTLSREIVVRRDGQL